MKKKLLSFILVISLMLPLVSFNVFAKSDMRNITTMELVREMGVGINLGNTLEACGSWINDSNPLNYETAWGSPVLTKKMVQGYVKEGFGVLRIPVAWSNMMQDNYTIHPDYMARVKQVVDWALESGIYVILNVHWDSGWWEDFPTDKAECMYKYTRIWNQLCDEFKGYNDYLMFESLNEEGGWQSLWNRYSGSVKGKAESYALLNEINQKFVDIVRKSGGNNAKRHLLIAGYNTDIDLTCDELFVMPKDAKSRCAVSVHYYSPSTFCLIEEPTEWGKPQTTWGSDEDIAELNRCMDLMKKRFTDNNIPVIIGEYGAYGKNKTEKVKNYYMISLAKAAYSRGMCPVLWDVAGGAYNRDEAKMDNTSLMKGLLSIKKAK